MNLFDRNRPRYLHEQGVPMYCKDNGQGIAPLAPLGIEMLEDGKVRLSAFWCYEFGTAREYAMEIGFENGAEVLVGELQSFANDPEAWMKKLGWSYAERVVPKAAQAPKGKTTISLEELGLL